MNRKFVYCITLLLLVVFISGCGERAAARRALREQQLNQEVTEPSPIGEVQDDLGLDDSELDDAMIEEGDAELDQVDEELSELDDIF